MKLGTWSWRKSVFAFAVAGLGIAALAHATNYSLWVNGRTGGGQVGNHADFAYWGPAATAAGVNKKSVNWDGYNTIASTNGGVRDALDCYCTGNNWCYVAAHSAGNLQVGYALSLYGGSTRTKKNGVPEQWRSVRQRRNRHANRLEYQMGRRGRRCRRWIRARQRRKLGALRTTGRRFENGHGTRDVQPQHDTRRDLLHVRWRERHACTPPSCRARMTKPSRTTPAAACRAQAARATATARIGSATT
jgi:hypothetical protein